MCERSRPVAQLLEHGIIIQERVFAHVFGVLTPGIWRCFIRRAFRRIAQFCSTILPDRRTDREKPTYIPRARVTRQRLAGNALYLSLIHISEPTRLLSISYAVFCLKKKKR